MNKEFKVGDRVIVIDYQANVKQMAACLHKTATIIKVKPARNADWDTYVDGPVYFLDISEEYGWHQHWLKLIEPIDFISEQEMEL